MEVDMHISIMGDEFSPVLFEQRTGLILAEKQEVGGLGLSGKYRGKPVPYGSAKLKSPNIADGLERELLDLISVVEINIEIFMV